MTKLLLELKNKFEKNKLPIIFCLIISISYLLLILYYTHGGLLYGGDQPGYYSIPQSLITLNTQNILYAFSLLISLNNFYVASYIELFISTFIISISIYS